MMVETFLRRLPKVDLHCHLAGTLSPRTMVELAAKNRVALPTTDPDELFRFADFYDFLDVVRLAARCLVDRDDFARASYEAMTHGAAAGNLRYAELFFNPTDYAHCSSYEVVVDGLVDGLRAAESTSGAVGRLVPSFNRELGPQVAAETLALVLAHRRDEVVGVGLDGAERLGPPARFAEVYRRAAAAGLRRTAHVCEDNQSLVEAPPSNVRDCLDLLGCDRLDHGYNILADPGLVARCWDEAVPFVVGSHTCVPERLEPRWESLRQMRDAGLFLVIGTDDPPMFHTDIGESYVVVAEALGLTVTEAQSMAVAAIEATWLDESEKASLRAGFAREIDALRSSLVDEAVLTSGPRS